MKKLYMMLALGLMLTSCEQSSNSNGPSTSTYSSITESDAEKAVSQRVRQALSSDNTLPASIRNVTISTSNGTVTLKGKVNTEAEKGQIANRVSQVQGVQNVNNQLEVSRS